MRFSQSAAMRLGVKPNSEMRAAIAASASRSATSAPYASLYSAQPIMLLML